MRLVPQGAAAAPVLAAVHAASFVAPWTAPALAALLDSPGVFALGAHEDETGQARVIVLRAVADEAEVLTLAVAPAFRRRGLGADLLEAGLVLAGLQGAESAFLEVAQDNHAALALYNKAGFDTVGRRGAYYARVQGPAADALVLRKTLTPAGA